jgi:phosphopantothenoylcysteine decarboxylase/phosphopantothenate--cysteine ligase
MIAANEVGDAKVFDCEDNHLIVLWRSGRRDLGHGNKADLARQLVALICEVHAERSGGNQLGTAHA